MQKILLTLIAIIIFNVCNAQRINDFFKKSPLQTAIENSIKPGLFIVRQNFVLRKNSTGEYFTQNGRNEFSFTYSLAVKTSGGYYININAAEPWKDDKSFQKLSNAQDYTPVISKTFVSRLDDKAEYIKIDTGSIKQVVKKQPLFLKADSSSDNRTFLPLSFKPQEYFTVWITIPDSMDLQKTTSAKMIFYTATENEVATGNITVPENNDKILGGIIVAAGGSKIAVMEFQLAGIIVPDGDKWTTVMLPIEKNSVTSTTDTPIELTPIQMDNNTPKNKKKKNERKHQ